jgi:predicted RNA-binding Zn ribbon-like protein
MVLYYLRKVGEIMGAASQEVNEWRDGFLFVGNRFILDFLNTRPVLASGPTELLPDFRALERWLIASGAVSSTKARSALRSWGDTAEGEALLKQLISFRERLRTEVLRMEAGELPNIAFVAELNSLLLQYPVHRLLSKRDKQLIRESVLHLQKPTDLWVRVADAAADLLATTEPARVRKCESCVVHFFDTSKKGSRRWCSMNICGNKLKVAAYRRRKGKVGKSLGE